MLKKLFGFYKGSAAKQDPDAARFGVDLEMNYCPACGDEYRADIEKCVSCNIRLVSGKERLEEKRRELEAFTHRSMEISADDQLVTIKAGKLRDLKPYQMLLARERIPALITGESGNCAKG